MVDEVNIREKFLEWTFHSFIHIASALLSMVRSIFNHLLNVWPCILLGTTYRKNKYRACLAPQFPYLLENKDTMSIPGVFRVDQVKQISDILVQLEPLAFDQRRQRPLSVTGEDEGRYDLWEVPLKLVKSLAPQNGHQEGWYSGSTWARTTNPSVWTTLGQGWSLTQCYSVGLCQSY